MNALAMFNINKVHFESENMKKFCLASLSILFLSACSQEAEPYKEHNESIPSSVKQGYIQTH